MPNWTNGYAGNSAHGDLMEAIILLGSSALIYLAYRVFKDHKKGYAAAKVCGLLFDLGVDSTKFKKSDELLMQSYILVKMKNSNNIINYHETAAEIFVMLFIESNDSPLESLVTKNLFQRPATLIKKWTLDKKIDPKLGKKLVFEIVNLAKNLVNDPQMNMNLDKSDRLQLELELIGMLVGFYDGIKIDLKPWKSGFDLTKPFEKLIDTVEKKADINNLDAIRKKRVEELLNSLNSQIHKEILIIDHILKGYISNEVSDDESTSDDLRYYNSCITFYIGLLITIKKKKLTVKHDTMEKIIVEIAETYSSQFEFQGIIYGMREDFKIINVFFNDHELIESNYKKFFSLVLQYYRNAGFVLKEPQVLVHLIFKREISQNLLSAITTN